MEPVMTRRPRGLWSAGGVVVLEKQGSLQIALCGRTSEGLWALPKGHPDGSESPLETALREVSEETGLKVEAGPKVGDIHYPVRSRGKSDGRMKTVLYYLMSPVGGDLADHDDEFDQVEWFDADDAIRTLTHENEARIVEKALALATG